MTRGMLITFEGIDGCGKDTQIELLENYLKQRNVSVVSMREPGGTPYGEAIRALLKHPAATLRAIYEEFSGHNDFNLSIFKQLLAYGRLDINRTPECELFLFEAARSEYAKVVQKILASGVHVISNRLHDSTIAYQGGGRGLPLADIEAMNRIALAGLWPDMTFLLDMPVDVMIERMKRQDAQKNAHFENTCNKDFFERVRTAYLRAAKNERERFVIIDADQPMSTVSFQIRAYANELLGIE